MIFKNTISQFSFDEDASEFKDTTHTAFKTVFLSDRPFICPSARPTVLPSVHPYVRPKMVFLTSKTFEHICIEPLSTLIFRPELMCVVLNHTIGRICFSYCFNASILTIPNATIFIEGVTHGIIVLQLTLCTISSFHFPFYSPHLVMMISTSSTDVSRRTSVTSRFHHAIDDDDLQ